jgi:hypothetical protein
MLRFGIVKGLQFFCIHVWTLHLPKLVHYTILSPTSTLSSLATTTSIFECCQLTSLKNSESKKKFKCNATQNEDTTKVDSRWFGKEPKAFVKAFLLFAKENWLTIKKEIGLKVIWQNQQFDVQG